MILKENNNMIELKINNQEDMKIVAGILVNQGYIVKKCVRKFGTGVIDCIENLLIIEENKNRFSSENREVKLWEEWKPILEKEHNAKIMDDDGRRKLEAEKMVLKLLTKEEAEELFAICTVTINYTGGKINDKGI